MEPLIGNVPVEQKHLFEMGKSKNIRRYRDIESFGVSHDAAAPQFYRFHKENHSFVMLTDTRILPSDYMRGVIENADGYLMKVTMILRCYAWDLIRGI